MSTAYARLPLNALRVFEAVASRLSFADAAEALHVTPAAVSQQIKSLEDYLQVQLFKRAGRRIELTAEGQQLLPGVRRGLDELEASMQHLKQHRAEGPLQVTLLSSFLQRWLLPRIGSFNDQKSGVELRFHTSRDPVDFSRSEMHVAIRMGLGRWPGLHVEKLLDEWVIPIGSPSLLAKYGPVPRGQDLQNFPLLGSEDEPWQAWIEKGQEGQWLARAPIRATSRSTVWTSTKRRRTPSSAALRIRRTPPRCRTWTRLTAPCCASMLTPSKSFAFRPPTQTPIKAGQPERRSRW